MSRKTRKTDRHDISPDLRYDNLLVERFINCVMRDGKKSIARNIFYTAMDQVESKLDGVKPLDAFIAALENIKPMVEVRSRRVGGANYQIPIEVRPSRRQALGIRWLLEAASKRGEKKMSARLANEILDAYNKTGSAIKKREDTHRMAEANKAFAHYRW